jgi:integrase
VRDIYQDMKRVGDHPDSVPVINAQTSFSDIYDFADDFFDIAVHAKHLAEQKISDLDYLVILESYQDTDIGKLMQFRMNKDHLGRWLHKKYMDVDAFSASAADSALLEAEGYLPPQKKWDEQDPEVVRYRIMCGENLTPLPTLAKHAKAANSLCIRLSAFLSGGMNTPLQEIETQVVEAFVDGSSATDSTNAKNLTILRAVWNSWNRHNRKQKVEGDPFEVAVSESKAAAANTSKKRRSLIPSEFEHFSDSIADEPDQEVRMIGKIIAYCGAPTIEAAKLQRTDVKFDSAVPYIVFRSTADSITGKDRLDRAVPLIEPLLSELRHYVESYYVAGEEGNVSAFRLFPRRGYGVYSADGRSKALKNHIVNHRPADPSLLSPYSLRHAFRDRASKAGVRTDIAEYLMGHKSKQSSVIHRKYGTKMPASDTVELMHRIAEVKEWGMIEEFDE